MKYLILLGILVFIVITYACKGKSNKENTVKVAKQITLKELEPTINQLLEDKMEYDFFGITSNGVDCIYFVNNKGTINIEFEVMTNEQKPFVEKIIHFTKENNYKIIKSTYGNTPNYKGITQAPVYIIALNGTKQKAREVGVKIMKHIFENNEHTKFDIVP